MNGWALAFGWLVMIFGGIAVTAATLWAAIELTARSLMAGSVVVDVVRWRRRKA